MKRIWIVAVSLAAAFGLCTAAWASANGKARAPQPNNAHPNVTAATPLDSAGTSTFTAVPACRVADTRKGGGALAAGHGRSLYVGGTFGFAPQGGTTGGCGIPAQAMAVSLTITAVAAGNGYLKAWSYGATEPGTSFLNYTHAFNAAVGGTVSLSGGRMNVKAFYAATQVIVDVTGYYIAPMWAEVSVTGALVQGSRVTGASQLSTGQYQVNFDRDVSGCAYTANSYDYSTGVLVEPRSGNADAVYVQTVDNSSNAANQQFYLVVTC